jgi:hypothetical protein
MAADRSSYDEGHSHERFDDALDFFSIEEGGRRWRSGKQVLVVAPTGDARVWGALNLGQAHCNPVAGLDYNAMRAGA